ncbi:hypothetical protein EGW08_007179 [Elysia chlorotica]|uniref:Uncharacterized protein n=1 Tax=Elysia chlorotica TaxID=188477 RepID=A0A433TU06_ELYCH|nr:hypothetical protein EGW08_007179 [Elysia chlorotica]
MGTSNTKYLSHNNLNISSRKSFKNFVPRVLADVNAQNILNGKESYDNFFKNCLLENFLDMFGIPNGMYTDTNQCSGYTSLSEEQQISAVCDCRDTNFCFSQPEMPSSLESYNHFQSQNLSDVCGSDFYPDQPPPYCETELPHSDDVSWTEDLPPSYTETMLEESWTVQECQLSQLPSIRTIGSWGNRACRQVSQLSLRECERDQECQFSQLSLAQYFW